MCEILNKISHRRKATAKNIYNAVALDVLRRYPARCVIDVVVVDFTLKHAIISVYFAFVV